MELKAIVAQMYAAFERGDVDAILARLAPDVAWDHWPDNHGQNGSVPFLQARTGPEQVRGFFELLATYTYHEFTIVSLMVGANKVAAEVIIESTAPNGVRIRDEQLHLFTFNAAGQVTAFRHYLDTAKALAVMKK